MEQKNALEIVPTLTAAVFQENSIPGLIERVRRDALALVPDASSEKGRKEVKSLAYKIARSKTALDDLGKEYVSGIKAQAKSIDEQRKLWRDAMDELKAEVMKPVTEYEEAETARVNAIKARIAAIQDLGKAYAEDGRPLSSTELQRQSDRLAEIAVDDSFEELKTEADAAWAQSFRTLAANIKQRQELEEQQAREEEQRKAAEEKVRQEREEQIRKEAAEQARREAEEKAKAEAERHEREKRQAEEEARRRQEQHEREKREAHERAERAARQERERIEQEKMREEMEAAKRQADREHAGAIHREIVENLMDRCNLSEAQGRSVVQAIVKGAINHVTITY